MLQDHRKGFTLLRNIIYYKNTSAVYINATFLQGWPPDQQQGHVQETCWRGPFRSSNPNDYLKNSGLCCDKLDRWFQCYIFQTTALGKNWSRGSCLQVINQLNWPEGRPRAGLWQEAAAPEREKRTTAFGGVFSPLFLEGFLFASGELGIFCICE